MIDLVIVIPVYNEAVRIKKSVDRLLKFFDSKKIDYKIVLAVDPSPDNSVSVCETISSANEKVDLIVGTKKIGRGYAVREAWKNYESKVYSFIDADLSVDEKHLFEGYKEVSLNKTEFVIGSRYSNGSKTTRPPLRKVVSYSYNLILRYLFKNNISDHQCGLKIVSNLVMKEIVKDSKVNSWFWDSEIIVIAVKKGIRITQLPVFWKEMKYERTPIKRLFHDIILHGWGTVQLYKRFQISPVEVKFGSKKQIEIDEGVEGYPRT